MKTTLVTGACGVSGRHLSALLANTEGRLCLTDLELADDGHDRFRCDLTDAAAVVEMVSAVTPERIYHLAGGYFPDYESNYRVNLLATKHLLDACLQLDPRPRVLLVGSAAEYGVVQPEDNPVREDQPLRAVSFYGLSKVYQSELMQLYCTLHGMDLVMARTFNLMGDVFSSKLFVGNLLRQIAEHRAGTLERIVVGNLECRRDYLSIDEAVRCYRLIMEQGTAGEVYNVGSGVPVKIGDLLDAILAEYGLDRSVVIGHDSGAKGYLDVPCIYADIQKFKYLLGKD